MGEKTKDELSHDHNNDGVDRRGFLKCMAWAGTGALCVMQGGVLKSYSLSRIGELDAKKLAGEFSARVAEELGGGGGFDDRATM